MNTTRKSSPSPEHIINTSKKVKVKADIAPNDSQSPSYVTSLAIWDHCHTTQVNAPRLTPAMQAGTRFTYPGLMEG